MSDMIIPEGQGETTPQPQEVPKNKSKIEILADFKKMLEKNGLTISEDILLGLAESMSTITIQGMTLERRIELVELQQLQPNTAVQKILVFPRGKHWIDQYDEWLEYNDEFYNNITKNFDDPKLNKPYIDKDHEYAESYGDIIKYEITKDGMYFYLQLNNLGVQKIKDREYRYISPSFGDVIDTTKKNHKNWMVTISLTNNPAFLGTMPEIQEQIQLANETKTKKESKKNTGAKRMNELTFKKLGKFVELEGEVSPEAVMQAIPDILAKLQELTDIVAQLMGENEQQVEVIQEQNQQLTKITNETLTQEADRVAEEAVKLGKWNCNEKYIELMKKRYVKDKEGVLAELALTPSKEDSGQQTAPNHKDILNIELTKEELEDLKELGYDINDPKQKELIKKAYGKEV